MAEPTYKFNVDMSCKGCSGAVNKILGKLDGVSSFTANHDIGRDGKEANVDVVGTAPYETVFTKINTAKKVKWGVDENGKRFDYPEKKAEKVEA